MNKQTRKRQITIERHSITIIRTKGAPLTVYCLVCQKQVSAVDSGLIANALQLTMSEIELMRESGEIHAVNHDHLQLCSNSIAELLNNQNREEKNEK
jgi:hypothetical protein